LQRKHNFGARAVCTEMATLAIKIFKTSRPTALFLSKSIRAMYVLSPVSKQLEMAVTIFRRFVLMCH